MQQLPAVGDVEREQLIAILLRCILMVRTFFKLRIFIPLDGSRGLYRGVHKD